MGRDQGDSGQFEWVNAWAAPASPTVASQDNVAPPAAPVSLSREEQLARDIAEIIRRRDALDALPIGRPRSRRRFWVVPATAERVPAIIGGVLALLVLTVVGAATAMTKLVR